MEDNKILKATYTFFLGLIISLFIGLGISTFYAAPQMPEYPVVSFEKPSEEEKQQQKEYDEKFKKYEQANNTYSRNVSIITLGASVVLLVISFAYEKRNAVISNGILLGSVFTLLYSIIRGMISQDSKYAFMAVSVGVLIALYLGSRHFGNNTKQSSKSNKKK